MLTGYLLITLSLIGFGTAVALRLVGINRTPEAPKPPISRRPTLPGPPAVPAEFAMGEWKAIQ